MTRSDSNGDNEKQFNFIDELLRENCRLLAEMERRVVKLLPTMEQSSNGLDGIKLFTQNSNSGLSFGVY